MDRTLNAHTRLHSLLWILCSTLLISGSALIAHTLYHNLSERRLQDTSHLVRAIVQPEERLPANQLASLLNLSPGDPPNLYAIDPQEAQQRLLTCPLIRSAKVKRLPPDALHIDVTLRTPYAVIEDHPGLVCDTSGVCFPYSGPFDGPTVTLGNETDATPALDLLSGFREISWVDLSRLHHPRYGLREIVVGMEGGSILRLPSQGYQEALENYHKLGDRGPLIVDLRLPGVAYIKRRES